MNFKNKFPSLFRFFAGYFPDADLDNLTDEAVVANFINDCNKSEASMKELEIVKKELSILINDVDNYWRDIDEEANRYFETPQDALKWLILIKEELEKPL